MERETIICTKSNNSIILDMIKSGSFLLLNKENLSSKIIVEKNQNVDVLIGDVLEGGEIHFEVKENANIHVSSLLNKSIKSFKITANMAQNSHISCHFADFIPGECHADILINLDGVNSSCDWHLASLSVKQDNKKFDVSVNQNATGTTARLNNYGVCRDMGKLLFSGICHIHNGSSSSKAHQNAKIMVFDELNQGSAKPILKIDENDVEASHAAVVGKISDDHIFYLTSRGLNEDEAKKLITFGYLKPIINGFNDDEMKEKIEQLIEGTM